MDPNIDCDEFMEPIEEGFNVPYISIQKSNEYVMKRGREISNFYLDVENLPSLIDSQVRMQRIRAHQQNSGSGDKSSLL
jgi:hypothetical protein